MAASVARMSTSRKLPHDPGDDVSSMCVNLRILSRLTQGEKLCAVKDKYYAVEDGTTYQSSLLRYVRNDSRTETCSAIETLFARVAAANNTAVGDSPPVPQDLIAAACQGVGVLMKTYAQDKQVVSRLEQVQRRYCCMPPTPAAELLVPSERQF